MTTSINHEEALIKAFIPRHRQERFLEIIMKPKRRAKLLAELYHFKALGPKFRVAVPAKEVALDIALAETVGSQEGTLISCVPGKLAYFEDEDERYILQRKG
jgi:hypothetical protein